MVGDSPVDMRTARAAGVRAVGVEWGYRSRGDLLEAGADRVVESARELADLLRSAANE